MKFSLTHSTRMDAEPRRLRSLSQAAFRGDVEAKILFSAEETLWDQWLLSAAVADARAGRSNTLAARGAALTVKRGPRGRGVFAERGFGAGEVVENCPTVEIADADVTGKL